MWEHASSSGYPTLWIGRTVSPRKSFGDKASSSSASIAEPHGEQELREHRDLEDEQDPAHGQGPGARLPGSRELECRGTPTGGAGQDQGAPGCGQCSQGPSINDVATTQGNLPGDEFWKPLLRLQRGSFSD